MGSPKIKAITLLGDLHDDYGDYKISVGIIDCEVDNCKKKNVLGVQFEYSWMSWEVCFECLEKAKKQIQSEELYQEYLKVTGETSSND